MITYSASDIIQRATELADLENSQFLTFREKIALLNEAYTGLYQKLVNKGDNNFVRHINTSSNIIELPPDFWQLKSVTINHNQYVEVVLKRPENQNLNNLSYDLLNNVLRINGNNFGGSVCISYYPVPATLTFPSETRELNSKKIQDMYGNLYITLENSSSPLLQDPWVLYDLSDAEIMEHLLIPNAATLNHIGSDYAIFTLYSTVPRTRKLVELNTGIITSITNVPVIYKGRTFMMDTTGAPTGKGYINFIAGGRAFDQEIPIVVGSDYIYVSDDFSKVVGITNNGTAVKEDGTVIPVKKTITKSQIQDNKIYFFTDSSYVATYDLEKGVLEESLSKDTVVTMIGADDDTGYGYLVKKLNGYCITSFFADTKLNFPNNMYFTLLAYLLALNFKAKQGSDTTQLFGLYSEQESIFYDTLAKDAYNSNRIINAY